MLGHASAAMTLDTYADLFDTAVRETREFPGRVLLVALELVADMAERRGEEDPALQAPAAENGDVAIVRAVVRMEEGKFAGCHPCRISRLPGLPGRCHVLRLLERAVVFPVTGMHTICNDPYRKGLS